MARIPFWRKRPRRGGKKRLAVAVRETPFLQPVSTTPFSMPDRTQTVHPSNAIRRSRPAALTLALALAGPLPGCATAPVPSAAPPPAMEMPSSAAPSANPDVRFIHGMVAHHAQALEMTALVPGRTSRPDVRLMAERIDASQRSEIDRMTGWLRARGLPAPPAGGHHAHHGGEHAASAMPGMATPAEMARLAAATGAEFDRLFLELMIRHHEGALVMVDELFATPGGGDDPEMYSIASEVDSDQRMEIDRMRAMQRGPLGGAGPR